LELRIWEFIVNSPLIISEILKKNGYIVISLNQEEIIFKGKINTEVNYKIDFTVQGRVVVTKVGESIILFVVPSMSPAAITILINMVNKLEI
jgi:hypothetical protein